MNDRCSVERAFITTKLNEYLALTTGCKNPRQLPEQEWNSTNTTNQGRNQLFILGGNFHELSFDDVIVLLRKRSQIKFFSQHFRKWELFTFNQDADRTIRTERKVEA